ncbi:hypothetical protein WT01_07970 [Burkholderia cepacia]|uniref:hypothetical protein n=1 Tax=Burkholderia cepacia TaxID=292 RepID=UPI0007541BAF|nr:hypothetical protein [Burkholderia cepacia]KVL62824.1 hypothetical protein WT01_07970 [Burkholderia cepacia]
MRSVEWPALPFAATIAAWEEQRRVRSSGLDVAQNRKLERQRLLEQQLEAVFSATCAFRSSASASSAIMRSFAASSSVIAGSAGTSGATIA